MASSPRKPTLKIRRHSRRWPGRTSGVISFPGQAVHPGSIGRAMNRGIGACFAEVEVDTWTGDWHFVRSAYCHDSGQVINPLVAEGDMTGSLIQSFQMTTDAIPSDRELPGIRHYSVGYLSYRLPTIMGCSRRNAGIRQQSGAALVLWDERLCRNLHRGRPRCRCECHLQRLRGSNPGTSDHP